MVNYRSKRYSLWIGPKRCRVDVKLVGSYICLCGLGILSRLCTWARPGRFRRGLRCTIGWLRRRLRLLALEGWNRLNDHIYPSILSGRRGGCLGRDNRWARSKLR
jgi:hypothetical protein